HTVCDTQKEEIRRLKKHLLFEKTPNPLTGESGSRFNYLADHCKYTNTPGGCLELFLELKALSRDLDNVITDCRSEISGIGAIKSTIWKSLTLLTQLAWGTTPPQSYISKQGWLSTADLSLFCDFKRQAVSFYGKEEWDAFRENMFKTLPGATKLARAQAWEVMLLSVNCNSYR
ncbi:MAG: hypothetical protein KDD50_11070, partial [Bdellovibrionales bacterium]|nr:hypothetical protein [Bdellovibrionales bacterium]